MLLSAAVGHPCLGYSNFSLMNAISDIKWPSCIGSKFKYFFHVGAETFYEIKIFQLPRCVAQLLWSQHLACFLGAELLMSTLLGATFFASTCWAVTYKPHFG
jgi:hypothetical protein